MSDEKKALEEAQTLVHEHRLGLRGDAALMRADTILTALVAAHSRPPGMTFSAYLRKHGISWTDRVTKN